MGQAHPKQPETGLSFEYLRSGTLMRESSQDSSVSPEKPRSLPSRALCRCLCFQLKSRAAISELNLLGRAPVSTRVAWAFGQSLRFFK